MIGPEHPRALLEKWSGESLFPVEDLDLKERRRAKVVNRIESAIRGRAQGRAQQQRRFQTAVLIACAAGIFLGFFWRSGEAVRTVPTVAASVRVVSGSLVATHAHQVSTLAGAHTEGMLQAGDEVATNGSGHALVKLANDVSITLEPATRFHLGKRAEPVVDLSTAARSQIQLETGVVHVKVPHLQPGNTFAVWTPDAEVIVHGTAFTVEVVRERFTQVSVAEGTVSIVCGGHEVFVTRGMAWASPGMVEVAPSVAAKSPIPNAVMRAKAPLASPAVIPTGSRLAEQNELLSSAIQASHRGQYRDALVALATLLGRYPDSPLAQEASVERFRAWKGSGDRVAAAKEARRYLARYPQGFAREEAKKLAVEP